MTNFLLKYLYMSLRTSTITPLVACTALSFMLKNRVFRLGLLVSSSNSLVFLYWVYAVVLESPSTKTSKPGKASVYSPRSSLKMCVSRRATQLYLGSILRLRYSTLLQSLPHMFTVYIFSDVDSGSGWCVLCVVGDDSV